MIYHSKRETSLLKIEMASESLRAENKRRRKHNEKERKKALKRIEKEVGRKMPSLKVKHVSTELPMLAPVFVPVGRKYTASSTNPQNIKSMYTLIHSQKYLCGRLGALCQALREANIPYPWLENSA